MRLRVAQVYLTITDPTTGRSQIVQEWDKLTNLPDSLAGAARGLKAGIPYHLSLISTQEDVQPRSERIYSIQTEAQTQD